MQIDTFKNVARNLHFIIIYSVIVKLNFNSIELIRLILTLKLDKFRSLIE